MGEVKQLISRLDNARNDNERLDALEKLNSFCKANAKDGVQCLSRIIELLHEEGSYEEYQECLDIILKLIKFDSQSVNIGHLLEDNSNIELLLDLLEHIDMMVGVMTSQILSEIHMKDPRALETAIQKCPAGMNKLLQRLPDRSREEVSNQAIILVQQLTAENEEMKKTVAFNEGFEIIFNIIRAEGGAADAGVVVEDCLKICNNTLSNSEICQRLFYGMGGGWHHSLVDFFDPAVLDCSDSKGNPREIQDDESSIMWFESSHRIECAILALSSLTNSIGEIPQSKHQNELAIASTAVVPAAAIWLTRRGPSKIVMPILAFFSKLCQGNAEVSLHLLDTILKISPPQKGKSVPLHAVTTPFAFSWKPLPNDERRLITLPALLLERYLFSIQTWNAEHNEDGCEFDNLRVLNELLAADPASSRLLIQFILAPPPPLQEDDGAAMESGTPLGCIILNTMLECMGRVLGFATSGSRQGGGIEVAERCSNVLTLVFIHGDDLTRELTTVLTTAHTCLSSQGVPSNRGTSALPLLSHMLSLAGKSTRVGEAGYSVAVAIFRMLAAAVFQCDKAARQMLDDPANLFVLDIANSASEMAGISKPVQIAACLFLGVCYHALKDPDEMDTNKDKYSGVITKASLLGMIDSRIGLARFTELLKLPLNSKGAKSPLNGLFFINSFDAFYEKLVDSIMQSLFEHYSSSSSTVDSPEKQIISIQLTKIAELEAALASKSGSLEGTSGGSSTMIAQLQADVNRLVHEKLQLESVAHTLANEVSRPPEHMYVRDEEVLELKEKILEMDEERASLRSDLAQALRKIQLLEEDMQSPVPFEKAREKKIGELEATNADLKVELSGLEVTLARYKKTVQDMTVTLAEKIDILADLVLIKTSTEDAIEYTALSFDEIVLNKLGALDSCIDRISLVAGSSSDMAESIGFKDFIGAEGSLTRIDECLGCLIEVARERDVISHDLESMHEWASQAVKDKETLRELQRTTEDEVVSLTDELQSLRGVCEKMGEDLRKITEQYDSKCREVAALDDAHQSGAQETVAATLLTIGTLENNISVMEDERDAALVEVIALTQLINEGKEAYQTIADRLEEKDLEYRLALLRVEQAQGSLLQLQGEYDTLAGEFALTKESYGALARSSLTSSLTTMQREAPVETDIPIADINPESEQQLRNALAAETHLKEQLHIQLQECFQTLGDLRAELSSATARRDALATELEEAEREFSRYREQMEACMEDERHKLACLMEECEGLRSGATDTSEDAAQMLALQAASEILQQEAASIEESRVTTEAQLVQAEADLADARAKLSEVSAECTTLKAQALESQFTIENLQNAVEGEEREAKAIESQYETDLRAANEAKAVLELSTAALREEVQVTANYSHALKTFMEAVFDKSEYLFSTAGYALNSPDLSGTSLDLPMEAFSEGLQAVIALVNTVRNNLSQSKRIINVQLGLIKGVLMWYQDLPLAKPLGPLLDFSLLDSESPGDAGFRFLDVVRESMEDMKSNLQNALRNSQKTGATDAIIERTPTKWNDASRRLLESLTPDGKDVARLHSEIVKERRNHFELKEQYNDLLELLAQQEVEIGVFRDSLTESVRKTAEEEACRLAIEKYGTYTNFRCG